MIVRIVILGCLFVFTQNVIAQEKEDESPEWVELEPLLGKAKDAKEVKALVKKYDLIHAGMGSNGSFTPKDHFYSLLYDRNEVRVIIVTVVNPRVFGELRQSEFKKTLPYGIQKTDKNAHFKKRFGKSTKLGNADFYTYKKFSIMTDFRKRGRERILAALFISPDESGIPSVPLEQSKKK